MHEVPISNEAISDVVWAALNLSDRCKGGTDININILPSGAVILDMYLQGYNKSPEYRQFRIHSDEDAENALAMIRETKERKPYVPTRKERFQEWVKTVIVRIDRKLDALEREEKEWKAQHLRTKPSGR